MIKSSTADLLFDPHSERRLLVGSFSKMMFPGLRLDDLVIPRHFAGPINRLRSELFREGLMLDQAVLDKKRIHGLPTGFS